MRRFPEAPQDRGELDRVRRLDLDDELSRSRSKTRSAWAATAGSWVTTTTV